MEKKLIKIFTKIINNQKCFSRLRNTGRGQLEVGRRRPAQQQQQHRRRPEPQTGRFQANIESPLPNQVDLLFSILFMFILSVLNTSGSVWLRFVFNQI